LQAGLREQLLASRAVASEWLTDEALVENFRLLQACDNLSLLSCVDFDGEATLLWPQKTRDGGACEVVVTRLAERSFRLAPYPFASPRIGFKLRARFVRGLEFESSEALQACFDAAKVEELEVVVSA